MRELHYAINVTLDGCVHHEAGLPPGAESMAFWTAAVAGAGGLLYGRGAADMKGGVAVLLKLAVEADAAPMDLTWIFYDHEEVAAADNSLTRLAAERPELLEADFAILMEPSNASIEAGCQGTMRVDVRTTGERSHSARSWKGVNAIHLAAPILARLNEYVAR